MYSCLRIFLAMVTLFTTLGSFAVECLPLDSSAEPVSTRTTSTLSPVTKPPEAVIKSDDDCPSHAVHACPTKCDPTCTKPLSVSTECPQSKSCESKSCVCLPGYVYDEIGKKCILSQYCPERCKRNEVWRLCPSACLTHCGNYRERLEPEYFSTEVSTTNGSETSTIRPFKYKRCPEDERDDYECEASCVCREGFIRDLLTGNCVTQEICVVTLADFDESGTKYPCPEHEHWSECVSEQCVKYCHEDYNPIITSEDVTNDPNMTSVIEPVRIKRLEDSCTRGSSETSTKSPNCSKRCVCDDGYMRLNVGAKCIPAKDCTVMLKYLSPNPS